MGGSRSNDRCVETYLYMQMRDIKTNNLNCQLLAFDGNVVLSSKDEVDSVYFLA